MPKFHETMRPILERLAQTGSASMAEITDAVVKAFSITDEEKSERLDSGQSRLANRIGWARTDLKSAGLIEYGEARGVYRITDGGRDYLTKHHGPITDTDLYRDCPPFREWRDGHAKAKKQPDASQTIRQVDDETPIERLHEASKKLRSQLADELMDSILSIEGRAGDAFFEHLVTDLLVHMGYGEGLVTKSSGDYGIDGIVKTDPLGFDPVLIQAKRYSPGHLVGRPEVQSFAGAMGSVARGAFITTSRFSEQAKEFAKHYPHADIVLIDGKKLTSLMIDYDLGVTTEETVKVKRIDSDYFDS